MDLKKELEDNHMLLLLATGPSYSEAVPDFAKQLASKYRVCYITLNKTSGSLREEFGKRGVKLENIIFIDAITRTIKDGPNQVDGVYFVPSPSSLTEISILLERLISHKFEVFIFDSITNLLIYQKEAPVSKFVMHLVTKAREADTKVILYALEIPEHKGVIDQCSMVVDKMIRLESAEEKAEEETKGKKPR